VVVVSIDIYFPPPKGGVPPYPPLNGVKNGYGNRGVSTVKKIFSEKWMGKMIS